ncbi:MAG: hypothetical protein GEU91_17800 [Rhizobiales bacterium]|nr:hypothetical protein [Hyphomicrobiales bacterium]
MNAKIDDICPRCGAHEQATHHWLCESAGLSDDLVRKLIAADAPRSDEVHRRAEEKKIIQAKIDDGTLERLPDGSLRGTKAWKA